MQLTVAEVAAVELRRKPLQEGRAQRAGQLVGGGAHDVELMGGQGKHRWSPKDVPALRHEEKRRAGAVPSGASRGTRFAWFLGVDERKRRKQRCCQQTTDHASAGMLCGRQEKGAL